MVHRSIDCSTWDDPWFADLQPKSKLLFLFLVTNRRVTQCGAMEITTRQIAFETGLAPSEIPNLIESFGDRVKWWPTEQVLFVRNFYRHQRANTGDKFDIAATKSAEVLPDFAKHWVYGVYPHLAPSGYTHPIPTPVAPPTHAISEAEAEAGQKQKNPPTPQGEPCEFVAFYDIYPRHTARQDALKAWSKINPSPDLIAEIMAGLNRLLPDYRAREPDKVPHPSTFLNGQRWRDDPVKVNRSNGAYTNGKVSTNDHAGEDREYLRRGLPPVWGSANGGIDSL